MHIWTLLTVTLAALFLLGAIHVAADYGNLAVWLVIMMGGSAYSHLIVSKM